ncbi:MAG: N-acetylmuramic acid 6-phosphate etherase [Roseimicrobium sp.]
MSVGPSLRFLGIETGATHTTALLADENDAVIERFELGPANIRLLSQADLAALFREIKRRTGTPSAVAAGLAGLRTEEDLQRVLRLSREVWGDTPFHATNDLETALEAAGPWPDKAEARVLLLSGTGSCAYGRNCAGRVIKFGGRGHILGDQGSACDIALRALRAIVYQQDLRAQFPALGQAILGALQLNDPDDLIPWTQVAAKSDIAALAITVFAESRKGDRVARQVLRDAADQLADMAVHGAEHLAEHSAFVQFVLSGSTLLKQPAFAAAVSRRLHERWAQCRVEKLKRESVWGAVALAKQHAAQEGEAQPPENGAVQERFEIPISCLADAPTEQRHPESMHLDTMPLDEAIDLMVSENEAAVHALREHRAAIGWLVERVAEAFQRGGRLFYVGAGTSGRLGVLDASECPPTFRVPPEQVQGIIAGGQRAIWAAVEGAEDDYNGGAAAVRFRGVRAGDVVLGIAASGRTPYVWGALHEGKKLGAVTALLAFHPRLVVPQERQPDLMLLIDTGPEVLTGSTRLKAGTATKVTLNTITTLAMVRCGKVLSNLMVDLNASNVKLRDRAVRLVRELTGCTTETARAALEKTDWVVTRAVRLLQAEAP